ncbi:MAG: DNA gyrase subunit A [Hyphomonadaceae bacterium]|nr:DNA gyrase subunit A [Clostridia bacterium]
MDYSLQKIIPVDIQNEMKKSYMDYAMSVIVGRALPDVRDGLKPVHRRILYTMHEAGLYPEKPYLKCATTVGDVLGKYHPHGDASVYDSIVRMAQNFSLRYTLVDGHGNFGSVDGDPPAAYRYTEAKMSKISTEMLTDIDKDTVEFVLNYDERLKEPTVLPSRFPNLLVNGSQGIAVGMATNIPPHNLTEVINGIIEVIDNPEVTPEELMMFIKGPDFPTASIIMGKSGIRNAYLTGRGKVIVRARAEIEPMDHNRERIVVTEIPYQVNKARLIEKIAELVRDKRLDGISDLRDESDRNGMRIVVELKRDANANVVLNQLYKNTQMQDNFNVNMLALVNNEAKVLNLRQMIDYYVEFQKEIIVRRTRFDLAKTRARAHILEGLRIALDHIDEIIRVIRASQTASAAKEQLCLQFGLSEEQAQAILDMRLARLTGLERDKIEEEYNALMKLIDYLNEILGSDQKVMDIIKTELTAIKERFGDERKSEITTNFDEIDMDDLIDEEDNVITLTHFGYIKRLPSNTYKSQKRGGKGIIGLSTREEDFVKQLMVTTTHHHILFFTDKGKMFRIKTYQIPEAGRQAKGTAIVNLLQLDNDEKITAMIDVAKFEEDRFLFMLTKYGMMKKTPLLEYDTNRKAGLMAMQLKEGDELIEVKMTDGEQQIFIGTNLGKAIHFHESDMRPMGRKTQGVRAIRLSGEDYIVGATLDSEGTDLLVVTENGFGKKTDFSEYRIQGRGGKGLITYKITEKTGKVAGVTSVTDNDDIMLINSDSTIIRMHVEEINRMGRSTQGVTLMRMNEYGKLVSIAKVEKEVLEVEEEAGEELVDVIKPLNEATEEEPTQA